MRIFKMKKHIISFIYDLLCKDNLTKKDKDIVKKVAIETLENLKKEKLKIERWRESNQVSAQVKIIIRECLLHLPKETYPDDEVDVKTLDVYRHIHSNYYGGAQPPAPPLAPPTPLSKP